MKDTDETVILCTALWHANHYPTKQGKGFPFILLWSLSIDLQVIGRFSIKESAVIKKAKSLCYGSSERP